MEGINNYAQRTVRTQSELTQGKDSSRHMSAFAINTNLNEFMTTGRFPKICHPSQSQKIVRQSKQNRKKSIAFEKGENNHNQSPYFFKFVALSVEWLHNSKYFTSRILRISARYHARYFQLVHYLEPTGIVILQVTRQIRYTSSPRIRKLHQKQQI